METGNFVKWEERFSIGVPLIDFQNKQLIALTNKLFKACQGGDETAKEQFKKTVPDVVNYINYHFSTEEQIMEKLAYPGLPAHRKEHTEFTFEVLTNVQTFESGKKFVPNQFVRLLKNWVLSHIAITDGKLGEFLLNLQHTNVVLEKITMKKSGRTDELKKVILAVDDQKAQLEILKNILPQYDVYTCESPIQALEIVKNMYIDIVLLDLVMEEMSGFEFFQHLQEDPRLAKIPVIIVSGNSDEKYVTASMKMGASGFVLKPVDPGLLREKIENLLR
jgi:hemerythrin